MSFAITEIPRAFLVLLVSAAPGYLPAALAQAAAPAQQPPAKVAEAKPVAQVPLRYVRAQDGGAKIYNLASKNAVAFEDAASKALLAVYAEQAGYLLVEPAAGLEVWVFGEFVKATDDAGVAEITGNGIRMRPLPSSDAQSYHLDAYLRMGDRVRMLARADTKKTSKEDWIKILAPVGTRAWMSATDTVPVAQGEAVNASWTSEQHAAAAALPVFELTTAAATSATAASSTAASATNAVKPNVAAKNAGAAAAAGAAGAQSGGAKPETAPKTADKGAATTGTQKAVAPKADESLVAAEKLLEDAKVSATPNFAAAKAAFTKLADPSAKSSSAEVARVRLDEIAIREEIQKIKADQTLADKVRLERMEDAKERLRLVSLSQDPLWGRFQTRGWVTREKGEDGTLRYIVSWSGKSTAELVCTSGRYDLAIFENSEVGIYGAMTRAAIQASGLAPARAPRVDVARIEVLSGRAEK